MRLELKRKDKIQVQSWINDKPISTPDWEVFASDDGGSNIILLVREQKTGNQLKINITKYENFEEVDRSGDEVPESI